MPFEMRSATAIEETGKTSIRKQRTTRAKSCVKKEMVAVESSSRHSLFWNGVEGLMRIHKNSDFSGIKKKPDDVEFGISDKNHKVCKIVEFLLW
jgi:hypothetical protein